MVLLNDYCGKMFLRKKGKAGIKCICGDYCIHLYFETEIGGFDIINGVCLYRKLQFC